MSSLLPVLSKYKTAPKFYANTKAESFPLGNIRPYSKSSIDIHVFDCRLDDVPLIEDDHEVILKYAVFMFMLYFWQIYMLQMHVIVLVILAIYRFVLDRNPKFYLWPYLAVLLGLHKANFLHSIDLVKMLNSLSQMMMKLSYDGFWATGQEFRSR